MCQQVIRNTLTFSVIALVAAIAVSAQTSARIEIPTKEPNTSWSFAQAASSSSRTILVYTLDHPDKRHTCHIQSLTVDKLVCSRAIGAPRTYLPQQMLALVIPGDGKLKLRLVLGFNAGLAAAIWGTVALAAATAGGPYQRSEEHHRL